MAKSQFVMCLFLCRSSEQFVFVSEQTILTEEEKAQFKPVCGNLKKGEASFHHALSVHGSYGNRYIHSCYSEYRESSIGLCYNQITDLRYGLMKT